MFRRILCILHLTMPLEIDDIEVDWENKKNLVNECNSIVVDNTGLIHFYIGGMDDETNIHYCNIHNQYEKVEIEW